MPRTSNSKLAIMLNDLLSPRFVKFLFVGVLNTAFGYTVYIVLILKGLPPQVSLSLSFGLGVLWNYFTTAKLVFHTQGFRRLPRYIVAYLIIYVGNAAALQLLLNTRLSALMAQAVLLPFVAVLAYLMIGRALTGNSVGDPNR